MLSHSHVLCRNTPSEYAWGQFSALLIPSGGGENIGEGFNGLTMWHSSLCAASDVSRIQVSIVSF